MVSLSSSEDIIHTQSKLIDAGRLYYLAAGGMLDHSIGPVNWYRVHFDPIRRKIGKPDFWNSGACVSRQFHKAVVFERRVGKESRYWTMLAHCVSSGMKMCASRPARTE